MQPDKDMVSLMFMRKRNLNNRAFSLLEILLAAVIFIVSIGGIFATLNSVRGPVASKENALAAAILGKQVLEALRSQVSYRNYAPPACSSISACPDFSLELGVHAVTMPYSLPNGQQLIMPANLIPFNPPGNVSGVGTLSYRVTCAPNGSTNIAICKETMARKVALTICVDAAC